MTRTRAVEVTRSTERAITVTSPAPRGVWEALLGEDPKALVTQTPTWLDAVCEAGPFEDASHLYELSGGRRLVLPLVRRRRTTTIGPCASLPPSWGFGGIVAPGGTRSDDVQAVFAHLASTRAIQVSIRPNPLDGELFDAARHERAIVVPRCAHVLSLEGGFDRVWNERFNRRTRNYVRKAERSGLVVERDTRGHLVPDLYELFRLSVERWAQRQHEPQKLAIWRGQRRDPKEKFQLLARRLGDKCRIWVAYQEGRPAAAILVLQAKNAHYTRGFMDEELATPTEANYLLQKLAIEEACSAGCEHYHMGESGTSAGLAFFKGRFGAEPRAYGEYRFERVPITPVTRAAKASVKRLIGFRD